MALYAERGFEQTTVADIAARAGLTKRTFFRHYADKRDVLFAGAGHLQEYVVKTVAEAPDPSSPIAAAAAGVQAAGALLQERRDAARRRQAVIDANPELQEREVVKLAALAAAVAEALRGRGVADRTASLAAEAAIAVFRIAFEAWIAEPDHGSEQSDLARGIVESFDALKAVTAGE